MLFDWSGRWTKRAALAFTALSVAIFAGAGPLLAQGAITGTVTDSETLSPIAGAQVFVAGTVVGSLTGAQGTYRLEGVPAGQQTVTIRLIGYKEQSQTVTVANGQVATADFVVEQTALRLQDIVVTGVVGETPRVKLPFTVERLDPQDLPVPASNVSSLLAAKGAGISVVQGSGQPGQAADITLRGPTSIDASGRSRSPLIVIDGVIQSENATLADVNSLDIDHIEIVKGAAAASLYGSRAQNGVIQISTKRGTGLQTNSFDVIVRGEYGFGQLAGDIGLAGTHPYVMNASQTKFITTEDLEVDFGDLGRAGIGEPVLADGGTPNTSFMDNPFPQTFDQLDRFFDPGKQFDVYGAITGRFGESSFRVSVDEFKQSGVVSCSVCADNLAALNADRVGQGLAPFNVKSPKDDGYERQNVRLNVDTRFGTVDVAASGFYSRSTQDDAAVANGSFYSLANMSPALDLAQIDPVDGYPIIDIDPTSLEENPLYQLAVATDEDKRTRTMGSVDLNMSPPGLDWLTLEANASYDRTDFDELRLRPKNEKTSEGNGDISLTGGSLFVNNFTDEAINASVTLGATQTLMDGDLTIRAKARYLIEDQDFQSNNASGSRFSVLDVPNFAAIIGTEDGGNRVESIKAEGLFGIASLDYKGKYILDGLIRRDGSSLFGPDERWQTYYRGSAAWRVSQEDFWNIDAIDELKFRFSLGTAGGRPNFTAQYETFGVASGAIFPINLGNRALKPEFTVEREAGVNLVLFDNLGIDYTYAWQTTDDQLLQVPQPAFVGFSGQWQNAGEVASRTHEISLRYSAIDEQDVGLQFRATWDRTRQEVTRLDVPDFTQGTFFVHEGAPLGEIWVDRWARSCADVAATGISAADCAANFQVNDDGLLVATGGAAFTDGIAQGLWGTVVTVNDADGTRNINWGQPVLAEDYSPACINKNPTTFQDDCPLQSFLPSGSTTPDWNGAFATNFRLRGFALSALVDMAVGHQIYNNTREYPLRSLRGGELNQEGKPDELKKPIGYYDALYNVARNSDWFVEDGDWVKLREVSVGYTLPQSVTESLFGGFMDRVTLSAIGRNLITITDYTGWDPEVGGGGQLGDSLNRVDSFGYPNFRTFTFSAEIVF